MNKSQWVLITTFAASFYNVGTIWMVQFGWRLWPYVGPGDFGVYHAAWWSIIKPFIFPLAAIAILAAADPESPSPGRATFVSPDNLISVQ